MEELRIMTEAEDEELARIRREKMKRLLMMKQGSTQQSGVGGASLPNAVINIGSIETYNKIIGGIKDRIIILEFSADWCGPCKMFRPIYDKMQKVYYDRGVVFTSINADHFPQIMAHFGLRGIPSMVFMRNGRAVHVSTGAMSAGSFRRILEDLLRKFP